MNFGTIGAGTIAQAVAGHLVSADQQVVLSNSLGPDTLGDVGGRVGPLASAGTVKQSAAADMVFLTVMWFDISTALADLAPWVGRVLVDATNQFASADPIEVADLGDRTGSEVVTDHAPGARVVKALNTPFASDIAPTRTTRPPGRPADPLLRPRRHRSHNQLPQGVRRCRIRFDRHRRATRRGPADAGRRRAPFGSRRPQRGLTRAPHRPSPHSSTPKDEHHDRR